MLCSSVAAGASQLVSAPPFSIIITASQWWALAARSTADGMEDDLVELEALD
jgi:hypothetical protein